MTDPRRAVEAVWRIESARVIAGLTRIVRDVGLAEELAQDAFVAALEQWPESGVPDNPGAWLMATAKHRAIDRLRRSEVLERKQQELEWGLPSAESIRDRTIPLEHGRAAHAAIPSATTCCGWCSSPATRCSPPRRGWRSRCGCSAA